MDTGLAGRVNSIEAKLIDAMRQQLLGATDDELRDLKRATQYLTFSVELRELIAEEIQRRDDADEAMGDARAALYGDTGIPRSDMPRHPDDRSFGQEWLDNQPDLDPEGLDDQADGSK